MEVLTKLGRGSHSRASFTYILGTTRYGSLWISLPERLVRGVISPVGNRLTEVAVVLPFTPNRLRPALRPLHRSWICRHYNAAVALISSFTRREHGGELRLREV